MPFDDIYDYATAGFEGGYVNDPYDSGGETYKGISRRSWPSWPGWKAIDEAKVKFGPLYPNYPKALADAINARFKGDAAMAGLVRDLYRKEFWDKTAFPAKAYTDRIHGKVFDTAVNAGISRAVKILQEAVGAVADGKFGPATAKSLEAYQEKDILAGYCARQAAFYRGIVARKPSQAKFLKGWLRRAAWIPPETT